MEARLWITPNIKAQLSLYNHWSLSDSQSIRLSRIELTIAFSESQICLVGLRYVGIGTFCLLKIAKSTMCLPRSLSNFQSMGFPRFVPERQPPQNFIRPSCFTVTLPCPGLVIDASNRC